MIDLLQTGMGAVARVVEKVAHALDLFAPGRRRKYLTASFALLGTEDAGTGRKLICAALLHPHREVLCNNSYLQVANTITQAGWAHFSLLSIELLV